MFSKIGTGGNHQFLVQQVYPPNRGEMGYYVPGSQLVPRVPIPVPEPVNPLSLLRGKVGHVKPSQQLVADLDHLLLRGVKKTHSDIVTSVRELWHPAPAKPSFYSSFYHYMRPCSFNSLERWCEYGKCFLFLQIYVEDGRIVWRRPHTVHLDKELPLQCNECFLFTGDMQKTSMDSSNRNEDFFVVPVRKVEHTSSQVIRKISLPTVGFELADNKGNLMPSFYQQFEEISINYDIYPGFCNLEVREDFLSATRCFLFPLVEVAHNHYSFQLPSEGIFLHEGLSLSRDSLIDVFRDIDEALTFVPSAKPLPADVDYSKPKKAAPRKRPLPVDVDYSNKPKKAAPRKRPLSVDVDYSNKPQKAAPRKRPLLADVDCSLRELYKQKTKSSLSLASIPADLARALMERCKQRSQTMRSLPLVKNKVYSRSDCCRCLQSLQELLRGVENPGRGSFEAAYGVDVEKVDYIARTVVARGQEEKWQSFLRENRTVLEKATMSCFFKLFEKGFALEDFSKIVKSYLEANVLGTDPLSQQVQIRKINDEIGYGVFARKDLLAGSFVGIYPGKILECNDNHNTDYVLSIVVDAGRTDFFDDWVIDARQVGNYSRFFNHSETQANLSTAWLLIPFFDDNSRPHIEILKLFFTNKEVSQGTELRFNYNANDDYWKGARPSDDLFIIHGGKVIKKS